MKLLSGIVIAVSILITFSCGSGQETKKGSGEKINLVYTSPRSDEGLFSLLNLDYPGMEEVRKYAGNKDYAGAKIAYLEFRRNRSKAKWDINPSDKPAKAEASAYPRAEKIMKHLIDPSMSAPEAFIGEDIDWEFNPVESTQPHFTKEWTWCNLNRMPFWNTLGRAYWATLDEKYANEWVSQLTDWVEDNPVPLTESPNGTLTWRTIESGIRMAGSWMNSYYYFLNSPGFTPDANALFLTGVIEHAQRLEKITLEQPERSGNWITMECNGMGTIGILFPELKNSADLVREAFARLNDELDKQVYPDGAEVELTTGYHQVSRSNFMELAKLAIANEIALPDKYLDKLKKMYQFNLYLMDPKGILPPFNDAGPTRTESSLREGYEIWKDPEFLWGATLGKEGTRPAFDSYYFNWAGYYVMRSGWNVADNCLYFDAGPVGYGHEHEDMLNMYLYSKGEILLTEPGTYSYDLSKWRRYILSTPSHNTIIVDGKEQHRADIEESRLATTPANNPWVTSALFDYGRGTYSSGYQENRYKAVQYRPKEYIGPKDTSISHTRHVIFLKPYYYIAVDFLEGTGSHKYEAHFHLDAKDAAVNRETMAVKTVKEGKVQLGLYPMDTDGLNTEVVIGREEPILGWLPHDKRPIPTIVYSKTMEAPAVFSTLLYPYEGKEPVVKYSRNKGASQGTWAEDIETPYENATIFIRRIGSAKEALTVTGSASFSADADLAVTRKPRGKNLESTGFFNLKSYSDKSLAFESENPSDIILTKNTAGDAFITNTLDAPVTISFNKPAVQSITIPPKACISIKQGKVTICTESITLL